MKHPIQMPVVDNMGVVRFQENKLISLILEELEKRGIGLNEIKILMIEHHIDEEDWFQLLQLIGYSLKNSPIPEDTREAAYRMHVQGENQWQARALNAEKKLQEFKEKISLPIANLFNICEEDLYK